jgi:hypothetical protein
VSEHTYTACPIRVSSEVRENGCDSNPLASNGPAREDEGRRENLPRPTPLPSLRSHVGAFLRLHLLTFALSHRIHYGHHQ